MVVLENKLTASATEIFSAAMQDYRRAPILGDSSSFGKGTVQAVIELDRFIDTVGNLPNLAGALKITVEKIYRVTGESTQLKGVISDIKIPSLTENAVSGEDEQAHRLAYDEVAPAAFDVAGNGKPLFLDELRTRSIARIKENPLFADIASENALAIESRKNNRISLNEKVRYDELTEVARLREKGDSDRKIAWVHDRNKFYQLMLADVDKGELSLINTQRETGASVQTTAPDNAPQLSLAAPRGVLDKSDSDALVENEAITCETLNILSDLVIFTRARQMAIGSLK
jgi:carboxyl-terminal processing protease